MVIALCIVAYLIFGFLLSMGITFVLKRTGEWDGAEEEYKILMMFCIILWPLYIIVGIIGGIFTGLSSFYDWFAGCFNEKKEEE